MVILDIFLFFFILFCRCQLNKQTLYYGFLLPMCLIMLHNIIVFCLVVKVISQQAKQQAKSSKNQLLCYALFSVIIFRDSNNYILFFIHTRNTQEEGPVCGVCIYPGFIGGAVVIQCMGSCR